MPPTDRGAYRGGGPIGWGRLIIHHLESDDVFSRSFLGGVEKGATHRLVRCLGGLGGLGALSSFG
jgi:hypothetical protein